MALSLMVLNCFCKAAPHGSLECQVRDDAPCSLYVRHRVLGGQRAMMNSFIATLITAARLFDFCEVADVVHETGRPANCSNESSR